MNKHFVDDFRSVRTRFVIAKIGKTVIFPDSEAECFYFYGKDGNWKDDIFGDTCELDVVLFREKEDAEKFRAENKIEGEISLIRIVAEDLED